MDVEKMVKAVKLCGSTPKVDQCKQCTYWAGGDMSKCIPRMTLDAATALSTLQAENEKLRNEVERQRRSADDRKHLYENAERAYMKVVAELEQVKRERDALIDDFVDYVTGGVPNPAIFCKNRCDKCTDMRGWCTGKDCKGFYPSGANGQKED